MKKKGAKRPIWKLVYICKYVETDGIESVAETVGYSPQYVDVLKKRLRSEGMFDLYKQMDMPERRRTTLGTYKKWTPQEEQFIIQNYDAYTERQLAEQLGRTLPSVGRKVDKLFLQGRIMNKMFYWSDEEVQFLLDNRPDLTYKEIAERLGRSEQSVKDKVKRMRKEGSYGKSM